MVQEGPKIFGIKKAPLRELWGTSSEPVRIVIPAVQIAVTLRRCSQALGQLRCSPLLIQSIFSSAQFEAFLFES